MDKKTVKRGLLPYLFIALIMLGMFYFFGIANRDVTVLTYNEFIEEMKILRKKTKKSIYGR